MQSVVRRAEEYARKALQWLLDDRIAKAVVVTGSIPNPGWLHLQIDITRATGEKVNFKYDYNWRAQELKHAV